MPLSVEWADGDEIQHRKREMAMRFCDWYHGQQCALNSHLMAVPLAAPEMALYTVPSLVFRFGFESLGSIREMTCLHPSLNGR